MKILALMFGLFSIITAANSEESKVLKVFTIASKKFAADVYRELTKSTSGNIMVCPLSANIILSLLHNGAKNETARQLAKALNLPEGQEKVKEIFKELSPYLHGNENYTLNCANKMFITDQYKIKESFKETSEDVFMAEVETIDFQKRELAVNRMNEWVEKKTNNKIKELISPDDLTIDTEAVLVNAMYFHGQWLQQFDIDKTKKVLFNLNKSSQIELDMMTITSYFNYQEIRELNAKVLKMSYEGEDVAMTIVLPNDIEGLLGLENNIEAVLDVTPFPYFNPVEVIVPKFKIETTIQFKEILESLGVTDAFRDVADFSDISDNPLKISRVVQKTFIEVEEKGTIAAVETAENLIVVRSRQEGDNTPKIFLADRPFIYIIKSIKLGVMFIGRFVGKT